MTDPWQPLPPHPSEGLERLGAEDHEQGSVLTREAGMSVSARGGWRLDPALARAARERGRRSALALQEAETVVVDGYRICPAIGRTGGADNVGWELHPPAGMGPPWYLAERDLAIAAIAAHRARYVRASA